MDSCLIFALKKILERHCMWLLWQRFRFHFICLYTLCVLIPTRPLSSTAANIHTQLAIQLSPLSAFNDYNLWFVRGTCHAPPSTGPSIYCVDEKEYSHAIRIRTRAQTQRTGITTMGQPNGGHDSAVTINVIYGVHLRMAYAERCNATACVIGSVFGVYM